MRPDALLRIARRNDVHLPARSEQDLADLYMFRDFRHFIEIYLITVRALRTKRISAKS